MMWSPSINTLKQVRIVAINNPGKVELTPADPAISGGSAFKGSEGPR